MNRTSAGVGIALGLCFAAALGAALQNVGVGIAIGVALGVAFSLTLGASDAAPVRKTVLGDTPLPNPLGLFERDKSN